GRKIRSPMVAQRQRPPSLWGGSEASSEWGFPSQTPEDRSVPETGARQLYRCGSCGGNFPSLPRFRVAANALHRSGNHLLQLMSCPSSAQLLLPGMCPLRGGSAEDRYRLIRTCSQCYRLHLALEDLGNVAKASAAALGGPLPMHDELSTVPREVDFYKARGFINILAAVGKVEAPAVEAGGASVVDFLPPGVSFLHSRSALEPESGEQLPLKTDSSQPVEVKVKLRWRVMLYITEVA
ncbi:hypothetical protein FOZ63_014698, partial [Perkinsus olseni]